MLQPGKPQLLCNYKSQERPHLILKYHSVHLTNYTGTRIFIIGAVAKLTTRQGNLNYMKLWNFQLASETLENGEVK